MEDGIIYWNVDPVIFWITDTFPVKYYGLFFFMGILLAYLVGRRIYNRENVSLEKLETLLTYIVIGIFVGARLGHCLFYEPQYYLSNPIEIFLPIAKINGEYEFIGFQGLASHGGGIGVLIAILWYSRKYKTNILWILDRVAIATPITGAFIRLGNLMNSEIYGKPTNGNWGVIFKRDDLIPRHPTQLYEAVAYIFIFLLLWRMYKSKETAGRSGIIFGVFLVLLFLARFIIEFFKENQVNFENELILNMGQMLSIPFILAGLTLIILRRKAVA